MIKTALVAASAFAMMSSMAFAQDAPGKLSPTTTQQGDTTVTTSGTMPQSTMPHSSMPQSSMPQSTMPQSTMATAPTMVANTPAGEAPTTYPKCTRKGQDRCMSMARR